MPPQNFKEKLLPSKNKKKLDKKTKIEKKQIHAWRVSLTNLSNLALAYWDLSYRKFVGVTIVTIIHSREYFEIVLKVVPKSCSNSSPRKVMCTQIARYQYDCLIILPYLFTSLSCCFLSFYLMEIWMHGNKHTWKHIFKTYAKINTLEISFISLSKNMYWQKDI